ncbi:MAG: hypothetical protein K6E62_01650 [Lachnospiraceae bacterium]|nr:hypothetical protein [Lachnospiraceae bacterium]
MERRHIRSRIVAIAICISLLFDLTGCRTSGTDPSPEITSAVSDDQGNGSATVGDAGNEKTSGVDDPAGNGNEGPSPETAALKPKISDNGKPISDFDDYVNREWKLEQEEAGKKSAYASDKARELVSERVLDILNNTDISGLPDDDGLKKAVAVYREIRDHNDIAAGIATIRDYLAPVEKAGTLEDLYELYSKEEYSLFNMVLRFEINGDENGNNIQYFSPIDLSDIIRSMVVTSENEEKKPEQEAFLSFAGELGFSEQRIKEIGDNSLKIAGIIREFPMSPKSVNYYFSVEQLDEAGVNIPVFDILRKLNSLGSEENVMAGEKFCELLNKLYVPENAGMLKDYLLIYAMRVFYAVSGHSSLYDIPDYDREKDISNLVQTFACDVLAAEYMSRYYPEDAAEELRSYISDIKEAARAVIYEADWLSAYSAEAMRAKLMKMRVCIGKNGYSDDLKEFEPTGNYVEDFIGLSLNRNRFTRKQLNIEGDFRRIFRGDLFDVNGFYFGPYYSFILTAGLLCDPHYLNADTFEEKLATLGFIIAHEISHAFDPSRITYDEYGYYNPQLKDEEFRSHAKKVDKLLYHYNGIEAGYGRKITGQRIINETYTDIMAMQICMKMLSEQEDPDYDLFFTTLAKENTAYFSEDGIDAALEDSHLPGNIRVNCILSQFDKFYETYDIDENSPFYVPEDKRLTAF